MTLRPETSETGRNQSGRIVLNHASFRPMIVVAPNRGPLSDKAVFQDSGLYIRLFLFNSRQFLLVRALFIRYS